MPEETPALFERAVSRSPTHVAATLGLCKTLFEISSSQAAAPPYLQRPAAAFGDAGPPSGAAAAAAGLSVVHQPRALPGQRYANASAPSLHSPPPSSTSVGVEYLSLELDRFAARDRAYGLLTALTQRAAGRDCAEAWLLLGEIYEKDGQVEKAREALWRCVELEDAKPVRPWRNAAPRSFIL